MKKLLFILALNTLLYSISGKAQYVSTLAGNPIAGYTDGFGTAAMFYNPSDICIDGIGTIYVADTYNHKIRKITPLGEVTTFAGSTSGFADGITTEAKFSYPEGICIDQTGNLYIADMGNDKIRKITTSGIVSTIAGSTTGYLDGSGSTARFNSPKGICVDASGNLFVTDFYNHRIRKITAQGTVSTFAGANYGYVDGMGTAAKFIYPHGICIDAIGNMYVADTYNYKIRKITPEGLVSTVCGSTSGFADGDATTAQFNDAVGVGIYGLGTLYVADQRNHKIRKVNIATGEVTTVAGSTQGFADGIASEAQFNFPYAVRVDAAGVIYVADILNQEIRKFDTILGVIETSNQNTDAAIYPNPIKDILNIELSYVSKNASISIINLLGRTLYSQNINSLKTSLDIGNYSKGIYLLKIINNDKITTKKLILE